MNFYLRISLFLRYMWECFIYRADPWNYFVLNSHYFNKKKGVFSKLEMDTVIPEKHKLKQYYYNPARLPVSFPVFIKPEWGQNSNGIVIVHDEKEYKKFKKTAAASDMPFIVQEAAPEQKEFEIYYLRSPENIDKYSFLSITHVTNTCTAPNPVNSIHNPCTDYVDITHSFSEKELQIIWFFLKKIGKFPMARVGLKANDIKDILKEKFHIVEINLFLPMPLVLLSVNINLREKNNIIKTTMSTAAKLVKKIPENRTGKKIFLSQLKAHYNSHEIDLGLPGHLVESKIRTNIGLKVRNQ